MNIWMLSTNFPPNGGGIAAHVYELSKALRKEGNNVSVITLRRTFHDKNHQEMDGVKVYRVYYPRLKIIGFFISFVVVWFRLQRAIRKQGIDIVHAHTFVNDALLAKSIRNVTKIQTEHSSDFLELMEDRKHSRLLRWLLGHADHLIGPSQELVDTLVQLGIEQGKTSYIPNGVDVDKFNPRVEGVHVRKKYRIGPAEKVILCPRRLEQKNGVSYFLKALPQVIRETNNVKCVIAGDGSEMAKLRRQVIELAIADRVILAGTVRNIEMPEYYAASDLVVLPSLKEATSIAGLEAMASGKPLVGTNVGGIPQIIVGGETGILVPPRDPEALANAIVCLLNDEEKRAAMGSNARKLAESEFSWSIIARRTQNLYVKVADSKKAASSPGQNPPPN